MFVAAFDDRKAPPNYFVPFIRNTLEYTDLNLISPAKAIPYVQQRSRFDVQLIDPARLPGYLAVKTLFDSVFINYSTNSFHFERTCFHRWFALNASTNLLNGSDYICLLDTDFLLGMAPAKVLSVCQKSSRIDLDFIATWEDEVPVSIGPEITILTKSYLFGFCQFLLTTYFSDSTKSQLLGEYFDRIGKGLSGGICDMRALASYARLHPHSVFNLSSLGNPMIIDNFNSFLNSEQGTTNNWKLVFHSTGQMIHLSGDSQLPLIGTHFQGGAKAYMWLACSAKSEIKEITNDSLLAFTGENLNLHQSIIYFVKSKIKRLLEVLLAFI